jgi:hypothetical protein
VDEQDLKGGFVSAGHRKGEAFAWSCGTAVRHYIASVSETKRKATAHDYRKTLTQPSLRVLEHKQALACIWSVMARSRVPKACSVSLPFENHGFMHSL